MYNLLIELLQIVSSLFFIIFNAVEKKYINKKGGGGELGYPVTRKG